MFLNRRTLLRTTLVAAGGLVLAACSPTRTTTTTENTPVAANAAPSPTTAAVSSKPVSTPAPAQPTNTPAPPPTPTIAATPTPKPTAKLEVGKYTFIKSEFGTMMVGFFTNTGTVAAEDIQIAISLLDDAGKTLGAANGSYMRNILPPGERSPFRASFSKAPDKWAKEKIQIQSVPSNPSGYQAKTFAPNITVADITATPGDPNKYSHYTIVGQVKNGGNKEVNSPVVIGIIYDGEGNPIDVNETDAKLRQIAPGETAPFELSFLNDKTQPAKYEVYPEAKVAL